MRDFMQVSAFWHKVGIHERRKPRFDVIMKHLLFLFYPNLLLVPICPTNVLLVL